MLQPSEQKWFALWSTEQQFQCELPNGPYQDPQVHVGNKNDILHVFEAYDTGEYRGRITK